MTTHALRCTHDALFIGDVTSPEIRQLLESARVPASGLSSDRPPLHAITAEIHQRRAHGEIVRDLHLIAHGQPGVLSFGDQLIDRTALLANAELLGCWGVHTIALWSCQLGADPDYIALLEELSGAKVLASSSWLGRDNGQEQIHLGDSPLSYFVARENWPEQFRLEEIHDKQFDIDVAPLEISGHKIFKPCSEKDLSFDSKNNVNVSSVPSFKGPNIRQDKSDVMISQGNYQGRVLDRTVESVAGSLIRTDFHSGRYSFKKIPLHSLKSSSQKMRSVAEGDQCNPICDPKFTGNKTLWKGCKTADTLLYDRGEAFDKVTVEGCDGNDLIEVKVKSNQEIKRSNLFGGLGRDTVKFESNFVEAVRVNSEYIGLEVGANGQVVNSSFLGDDLNFEIANNLKGSSAQGADVKIKDAGNGLIEESSICGLSVDINAANGVSLSQISGSEISLDLEGDGRLKQSTVLGSENGDDINIKASNEVFGSTIVGGGGNDQIKIILSGDNNFKESIVDAGAGDDEITIVVEDFIKGGTLSGGSGNDTIKIEGASNNGLSNDISIRLSSSNEQGDRIEMESLQGDNQPSFILPEGSSFYLSGDDVNSGLISLASDRKYIVLQNSKEADDVDFDIIFSAGDSEPEYLTSVGVDKWTKYSMGDELPRIKIEYADFEPDFDLEGDPCVDSYFDSGKVKSIDASAKCDSDLENLKKAATFSFDVSLEPSDIEAEYGYVFDVDGLNSNGGYKIYSKIEIDGDNPNDGTVKAEPSSSNQYAGDIIISKGISEFTIDITLEANEFSGDEELTLEIVSKKDSENSAEGTASLDKDDCEPVTVGEVESVKGTAACEIEGTVSEKDARFRFDVSFDPVGSKKQRYGYEFSGDKELKGYEILDVGFVGAEGVKFIPSSDNQKEGTIVVSGGVEDFAVFVELEAPEKLEGDEELTLEIVSKKDSENSAEGTASLDKDDCEPVTVGEVEAVLAIAACEREGLTNKHRATFSFDVVLQPGGLQQIYNYDFQPSGFQGGLSQDQIEITGIEVSNSDTVQFLTPPSADGQIQVDAGVESFRIDVSVSSKGMISGEEALELTIHNELSSASGSASLSEHDCETASSLEDLEGLGYCKEITSKSTTLDFIYRASFEPGPATLYGYELGIDNLSLSADYTINALQFTDAAGGPVDVQLQIDPNAIGMVLVGDDVDEMLVTVETDATGELSGNEALTFTLGEPQPGGGVEAGSGMTAMIGSDQLLEGCDDPLVPQVVSIEAAVDCNPDDDENVLVSQFVYDVSLIPDDSGPKKYSYSFVPSGFEGNRDDYSIRIVPSRSYSSKDLESGALEGQLKVEKGVQNFKLEIDIESGENLVETESLSLTFGDKASSVQATASLETSDCIEQVPDSHLYLLMNNSTSMLSSEPSTRKTSDPNMLEAQNRIAFYSFDQAAAKAGFGFRNKKDDTFESFGDASRNAILSNSTKSLAKTLQDYELVDDPFDGKKAGKLVVHMITYGYVVDYRREDFSPRLLSDGSSSDVNLAQRILLTSTPNQLYGNSIDGNPQWSEYGLPDPTEKDYFPRNWKELGVNASNLYAGTEMLGAFTGLTHLLREKRQAGLMESDESISITVATDGRPERRPWWDNRADGDQGLAIPLPSSLGGDEITAAGLLYANDGSWEYNLDNEGIAQWPKMQKRMNKEINRIAKNLDDPSSQIEVDAIGLGEVDVIGQAEDDVVHYPAIYENLFNDQTFNKSSIWSYNVVENLPEFFD